LSANSTKLEPERGAICKRHFAYVVESCPPAPIFGLSDIETEKMIALLQHVGHLPEAQSTRWW